MQMTKNNTALAQGLMRCHDCGKLEKIPQSVSKKALFCSRCGCHLHARFPHSFQRTLALLLSGFALYIPANLFPIMTVTKLGVGEPHTILGGIVALIHSDMLPIALLVLVGSTHLGPSTQQLHVRQQRSARTPTMTRYLQALKAPKQFQ